MRTRAARLCLALALLLLGFSRTLLGGFPATEVFIPAVGRVTGLGGSEFYTTVWITNLSSTASVNYQFQFLRTGQANTSPLSFSDTLAPGQTKIYENIVESRFGLTGVNGAGRIVASGEVHVSSRIYEQPPGTDLGSSKGLFFSGVPASFGLGVGDRASLQGVNQGGAQNLRYNFVLLEVGGQPTTVHVDLKDASGATLAGKDYTLQAYEHRQLNVNDVLASVSTTNARLESAVTSGAGKVLFAGAQVTNVSQDPTGFEMSFKGSLLGGNGLAGVQSLNGLMGNVTLAAGTNITITTVGNSLRIADTNGAISQPAWFLTGNNVFLGQFLGSLNDQAVDIRVNNQRAFRLEPNATSPNVIGGHASNSVTDGVIGATIGGGGGDSTSSNRVTDNHGTVGGGRNNQAGDGAGTGTLSDRHYATVGGGTNNEASGESATVGGGGNNHASGDTATVAGGQGNFATGQYTSITGGNSNAAGGSFATVAGGQGNVAQGNYAFIGGGQNNDTTDPYAVVAGGLSNQAGDAAGSSSDRLYASVGGGFLNKAIGAASTVPGGVGNVASGTNSFAAGSNAKADHNGAFVWGDSTDDTVTSTGANQFVVRAYGGARFLRGTNTHRSTLAALQVEHAGASGEAAFLYTANSNNPIPVLNVLKHPAGANNFLNCTNYDGVTATPRCHITAAGTFIAGSDFAEALPAKGGKRGYEAGDVLVASSEREGSVERSSRRYDARVIGVYSTRPAVLGADKDGETRVDPDDVPVAITGIVPTRVTAENGPIVAGELLTTSSTPGHAMKATPVLVGGVEIYRAGTVLGKALTSLHGQTGVIKVLVMLR